MHESHKIMNFCRLTGLIPFSPLVFYLLVLFIFPSATSTAAMQNLPSLESPPLVRLTGSFLRLDEPSPAGLSTLTVSFKADKRSFVVKKIEKLTGKPTTDLRLLESLFPPALRFAGPPDILDPLWRSNTIGKSFVLEGRLYSDEKMLFLLSVKEE